MPKCKTCGRWGLFLKLQKGLCSTCLDALFDSPHAFITREQFLNPPPVVPEEPVKRNDEYAPDEFVVTDDGNRMEKEFLPDIFDWDGIARVDKNFYEITSSKNIQTAIDGIMTLNMMLDEAAEICKTIPNIRIIKSQLRFKFDPYDFTRHYCTLSFVPKTPKGKLPKAMVDLQVVQNDNVRGEITYDNQGTICNAKVSTIEVERIEQPYLITQNVTTHQVIYSMQNGIFKMRFIYKTVGGVKEKIYDSKV